MEVMFVLLLFWKSNQAGSEVVIEGFTTKEHCLMEGKRITKDQGAWGLLYEEFYCVEVK